MKKRYNPDYIHHKDSKILSGMRDIVFGLEDGMVSTLGAITGIAVGSQSHFTVILAGMVIIAVESISMGIGSYISNMSEHSIIKRKLYEEKTEIEDFPQEEKEEMKQIYIRDGWPKVLAGKMAEAASKNKKLLLHEMAHHELNILPSQNTQPISNGVVMFFAYIIGGLIPLFSYFILPIDLAIKFSIIITLIGLFLLGASTAYYTKGKWAKMGLRVLLLGGIALLAGYLIGKFASSIVNIS